MKLLAAFLVALAPGLLNWIWGRGLLRLAEAADLPERLWRHRQRITLVTVWGMIGSGVLGGWWMVPVVVVGLLVGWFPARRRLYEETWSLFEYASFQIRLYLAFGGFWILLALIPVLLLQIPEPWMWSGAGLAAGVLYLLARYFPRLFPWILGAEPLAGEVRAPFEPYFAPILERTTAPEPALWWVRMGGGRLANAVALPGLKQSGVLFWETLLRLFEPREVGAVFAHEVAHLEQFDRRYLTRSAYLTWMLILLAVTCVPLTVALAPGRGWLVASLWVVVVVVGMALRTRRMRQHETPADLRALELCGDGQALISALEKLHTVQRLPRRLALSEEGRVSHPSLARRVAAIRQAAEVETEGEA